VPLASLLVFAALTVPLAFTDPSLTTRVIGTLFAAQAVLYAWLLYIAARLLSRRIPPTRRAATVIGVAVALLLLALCAVYVAPLSHGPGSTNWFGLWD
jgi:tetrahydromethanopterin S-methyltransferase subunit C